MEQPISSNITVQAPQAIMSDINKWSWGGLFLSFIWALGSRLYWRAFFYLLLLFIPVVNIIMMIYLGARGRRIAWASGQWATIEEFKERQKLLDIAGVIIFVAGNIIFLIL